MVALAFHASVGDGIRSMLSANGAEGAKGARGARKNTKIMVLSERSFFASFVPFADTDAGPHFC